MYNLDIKRYLRMLLHKTTQAFMRRKYTNISTVVLLILLSVLGFRWMTRWTYDRRCIEEIGTTAEPVVIQNGTKAEIISQFLRVYDTDVQRTMTTRNLGARADSWMNCKQIHPDLNPDIGSVLHWLSTVPITKCLTGLDGKAVLTAATGSTLKFQFILEGGYKALFKVKQHDLNETMPVEKMRERKERHNSEIASYQLQRILGFNRAPIVVGRRVNFIEEMLPVADDRLRANFFFQGEDVCFKEVAILENWSGRRTVERSICAKKGIFEGAMILWLPREISLTRVNLVKKTKPPMKWYDTVYLDKTYSMVYNNRPKLLDLVDTLLLDHLIQNADRNSVFCDPSFYSSILLLDHGKSFCNPFEEIDSILEAFSRLCLVRRTTFTRLQLLSGGVLSTVLRQVLSRDPIAPVLWEPHFEALDRRLKQILNSINDCIRRYGADNVILDEPKLNEIFYVDRSKFDITLLTEIAGVLKALW